jgi:hypothetical protein
MIKDVNMKIKGTATLVKTMMLEDRLNPGYRKVYRIHEPARPLFYIAIDYARLLDEADETMAFKCDSDGEIINYNEIASWPYDFCLNDIGIKKLGYQI